MNQQSSHVRSQKHHSVEDDAVSEAQTELFMLEDMPRVKSLNDAEVHSIDSALLSAEEQDLMDSSSVDGELSSNHKSSGSGHYVVGSAAAASGDRRMSHARRVSAVQAARRLSSMNQQQQQQQHHGHVLHADDIYMRPPSRSDRRISVIGGNSTTSMASMTTTPSTLRRNVSAFGEITVMPVGEHTDRDMSISVEEEFSHSGHNHRTHVL